MLKRFLLNSVLLLLGFSAFSQLQITPQTNATQLAQYLVGDGVLISNITINGSPLSTGYFKNLGGTQLGLDSGIVMSTGRVLTSSGGTGLNGPATAFASTDLGLAGDPQLDALLNNQSTQDVTILEFDFVPQGDTVSFRYIFSSEEYPGFTCTNFNDVFAFFISGPGITGSKNIALVPNTNIPVAINSVNDGVPGGGGSFATCANMGVGSPFTQHYLNNAGSGYFTHGGHTKVFTARSAVQPCETYHLKIAIGDVSDGSYDSNVFIEARSLKSSPIQLISANPEIGGFPYLVEGCHDGAFKVVRSRKFPYSQPIALSYGGDAINGVDVQLLPSSASIPAGDSVISIPIIPIIDNMPEGIETLKIYVSNGCVGSSNFFLDSLEVQIRDVDVLNLTPGDTILCKNNTAQFTAEGTYANFQWSPAIGLSDANISNPVLTAQSTQTYVATATLNDCTAQDSIRVIVKGLDLVSKTDILCKDGTTGQITVTGGPEWGSGVQYSIDNGSFGPDSTFNNLAPGTYTINVNDNQGCTASIPVTLVQSFPDLLVDDSIITASCVGQNGEIHLNGSGGSAPYTYSIDNGSYVATPSFTGVTGGSHTINIKDDNGCITSRPVTVANDAPITLDITVDPASCNGSPEGKIYFTASGGSSDFTYSIDGTNFQVEDSFIVYNPNITGIVKDSKGCTASETVTVPLNIAVFVNAGNDTTICEGTSFTMNAQGNASSFVWEPDPSLSNVNILNPVASPLTSTTYYVTATQDICVVKDTINVMVRTAPVANAGPDSSICLGRTIQLSGSGGVNYVWTPNAQMVNPDGPNPSVSPNQTTDYYLTVIDANGCSSLKQDTVRVTIVPSVQAFAGEDMSVGIGQPVQLNGVDLANTGVTIYEWSPPIGLSDPNIPNPIATIDNDITYTLTLTTPQGCQGTDQITIRAFEGPEIYVPTGFTPNGDGKNDVLRAFPVGMVEFRYFKIFNRWGQMIFSTPDPNRGWDGTINGLKQPTGTFVWVVEAVDFNGNVFSRRGTVTLIR